jgi:chemotaxis protein histidine kinase CheA
MTDPLIHDLRARFRETARVRLEEMTALLEQLGDDPADRKPLQRLSAHFHGLAGMGGTYGFPRVSELGDEAEGLILPFVKRGEAPDAATLARWKAIVGEIRGELGS